MAVRFSRYDRWGKLVGTLQGVQAATWTDSLDGSDTLEIECTGELHKGDRLVWADRNSAWHEHVVAEVELSDDFGAIYIATCENSISELLGDYILDKKPTNATARDALFAVLQEVDDLRSNVTRWEVGDVTVDKIASTSFYRQNCRECVNQIVETWGGDLSTTIEVVGTEVVHRKVNLTTRGSDRGRRFTYSRDMDSISRTYEADDVVTALYGYGKGESVGDGYGRRIDFSDQPDTVSSSGTGTRHVEGTAYVENPAALEAWGRPGIGGKAHVFGQVEFSRCEDPAELMQLTMDELDRLCEPLVSYEASVQEFRRFGYDFGDCEVGDIVSLVDATDGVEIRVKGRVSKIVRDLLDDGEATDITIGNIAADASSMMASQSQNIKDLSDRASAWDVAAYTTSAYMQQLIGEFNERFEEGQVYKYEGFGIGTIYSSVPLDENMRPTETPAKAMQFRGGGWRIADSVDADGDWEWSTMADGSGIIADAITSGILNATLIRAGVIQDMTGRNYWNLETGELRMTGYAASDDAVQSVVIEYALGDSPTEAPSTGWATGTPVWTEGKYIWQRVKTVKGDGSAEYSNVACIQGAEGPQGPAGEDGKDGADGTSVTIKGQLDSVDDLPQTGESGDSYLINGHFWVWTGSTWTDVGQIQGPQGPQGPQGNPGKNGTDGTDGKDGAPGKDGVNGKTAYVHIAYSMSADGSKNFSTTPFLGATYIGTLSNFVQEDSENYQDYTWALFKGSDGVDGLGISSIVTEYYLSTSETETVGGSWSTSQPAWSKGHYIWIRSKISWEDGTTTYTDPEVATAINGANEAVDDLDQSLDQEGVFNRLTNNGLAKGIYMEDNDLFINADYIKTGTIVAKILRGDNGRVEISPANLSGGSIVGLEMSAMDHRGQQDPELAPSWGIIPTYSNETDELTGFATLNKRKVIDYVSHGTNKLRVIGIDGVEIDPDNQVTVSVDYPYVYLSNDYLSLMFDNKRYVSIYDSSARIQFNDSFVDVSDDGVRLGYNGVPANVKTGLGGSFSINVGGLSFSANTGGMSLSYNGHGFSIEMDGSIHVW